jgi:hypothetical protein
MLPNPRSISSIQQDISDLRLRLQELEADLARKLSLQQERPMVWCTKSIPQGPTSWHNNPHPWDEACDKDPVCVRCEEPLCLTEISTKV